MTFLKTSVFKKFHTPGENRKAVFSKMRGKTRPGFFLSFLFL